jgi:SnoaL-like domain
MNLDDELLATFALRQVAERYAMAVDRGDGALFAAQFTADGVLEAPRGKFIGRDRLADVPPMMTGRYDRTHHGVVGLVPVFDGDNATAETYSYARHYYRDEAGVEQCYEMTIRYDDRFRRQGRAWLIAHRKLVLIGEAAWPTGRGPRRRAPDRDKGAVP